MPTFHIKFYVMEPLDPSVHCDKRYHALLECSILVKGEKAAKEWAEEHREAVASMFKGGNNPITRDPDTDETIADDIEFDVTPWDDHVDILETEAQRLMDTRVALTQ